MKLRTANRKRRVRRIRDSRGGGRFTAHALALFASARRTGNMVYVRLA
jgi:hypothetical protein